jgi:hypothetical protein
VRKSTIFTLGVVTGVIAVKLVPKTKLIRYGNFAICVIKARHKLQKILIEEYYRVDEALDTEQKFLNMIGATLGFVVEFRVEDSGGDRQIVVNVSRKKDEND